MIKVLVSGVGSDVAQGVIKCLNKSDLELEIYKISSSVDDSWLYLDNLSYISPSIYDDYISYLIKFINKHKIDIFFPCIDLEIPLIAKNKKYIESLTNAVVFVGDYHKVEICNDKYITTCFLDDFNFNFPKTILINEEKIVNDFLKNNSYPFILKKREGCGSKEIYVINKRKELEQYIGDESYILQELLPEPEYTAGIYLGDDGEVKGSCILQRELKDGSTYSAERIVDDNIEKSLNSIAKALKLKYLNVQFRMKEGNVYPFELNGRFSGTTGIISKVFNAPEMAVRETILSEEIKPINNREKFYVMRYYDEIYTTSKEREELIKRSRGV
jgi:carbamoyl-phosphate synthase large subunit